MTTKQKKIFLICLMVVMNGFVVGSLFASRDYDKHVTLKWARSSAERFQEDIIKIMGEIASFQARYEKDGIDFKRCFISSDFGTTRLIKVDDPLFQENTTEKLLRHRKFVRMSPVFMKAENFNDCRSCHRHEDIAVGEPIGAIVTTIQVGYVIAIEEPCEFIRSFFSEF